LARAGSGQVNGFLDGGRVKCFSVGQGPVTCDRKRFLAKIGGKRFGSRY